MSEYQLDARRLLCPMPVIRTQDAIAKLQPNDILLVTATDPGVLHDIPTWCRIHQHEVLTTEQTNGEIAIKIRVK